MSRRDDEGIEIDFPFFRFYAGERGVRFGGGDDDGVDPGTAGRHEDRGARGRAGVSGPGITWSIWVIIIWGVFLGWEPLQTFVAPKFWGSSQPRKTPQM